MNALRAAAAALLYILAACATATQPVTPNAPGVLRAHASAPIIYLFDGHVPPTAIDEIPITGGPPVEQIRNGLTAPGGGLVDKNGTLYVVNFTGAQYQILEYPSGTVSPALTITNGIGFPGGGFAVGPKSELYVFNLGGPLVKYDSGSAMPSYATYRGICPQGSGQSAVAITVDRFQTLYALQDCRKGPIVREYDGGLPRVARTIRLASNEMPVGLTADKTGTLYITYFDTLQRYRMGVAEYSRGATTPSTTFDFGPLPKIGSGGSGPVVDEVTGRLYTTFGICTQVSSGHPWHCAGYIYGFRRGSRKPEVTIAAPHLHLLGPPRFDTKGNLYAELDSPVSAFDSIWRYSASGMRERRIVRNRSLDLITVWPNADSASVVRSSTVTGFAADCQSTPMSQSSPRSFLANERNAMSVSVFAMPSSAATCSVTRSLSCSCSFTRATATRSNGPATE